MSQAGHLQVGPADAAGEDGAFYEVPFAVGQPQ